MHSQALCFRCKKGGQRSGAGMVTAGLPVRGPARLWSRSNAPTPHSLPTASSFLLLVNDFLSGPGSPEDGRVGVGYLIEGRCDCSRFKLEPWSLCSFLFCGFSEVHIGPSKGRAISEATSHRGPVRRSPGRLPPRPPKKSSLKPLSSGPPFLKPKPPLSCFLPSAMSTRSDRSPKSAPSYVKASLRESTSSNST